MAKIAVIAGGGPAGLTAAYELLKRTDILPIVCETTDAIGGIAQTYNYKGNRIDLGGHRFFSKDARVTAWWEEILPMQGEPAYDDKVLGRASRLSPGGPDPEREDLVMLWRRRVSRIYFDGH
ncbi:MAG: NAD(P)-binding protein, partial [Candidatus Peribacteraceae bacterium]|nr:NAD(P)-binding protein [Candidatus Peribacteraceae bacterium]